MYNETLKRHGFEQSHNVYDVIITAVGFFGGICKNPQIDTHQRLVQTPFRSQKPVGVIQEFYALLLAYFIICCWRYESAEQYDLSPQQLSFINGLRLIEHMFPIVQFLGDLTPLKSLIHQWHYYFQLPPRDNRINPRVVKRKMSKFRRKKPDDVSAKGPDFEDTIYILQRA